MQRRSVLEGGKRDGIIHTAMSEIIYSQAYDYTPKVN